MTENEAIKRIREQACNDRFLAIHCDDSCMYGDGKCEWAKAIQALEEIQAYRAIGTVEGYKRAVKVSKENYYLCAEYKARLKEYEAIGTIDEFKALKEKSADIEKIIESIKQLPTQDFMGVLHIPRTATINRIKRGGNCELPEV